jgi:hypothetical protein
VQQATELIKKCPVKHILVCGWPCWVVADFMGTWGWERAVQEMLCVMSAALLPASGISVELLKKRLGIGVKKQLGWCLIATCGSLSCALTLLCLHFTTLVALWTGG